VALSERPGSPSPSSGPLPRLGRRLGGPPPVSVTQLMHLAGGLGLAGAISAADFLSTAANVIHFIPKLTYSFSVIISLVLM
jgi:hypothetical protein